MTKQQDREFKDVKIASVRCEREGCYSFDREDGWSFFVENPPIQPKPGMVARFYGQGIGHFVRGLDIDGHECFYRTSAEEEQKRLDDLAERERKERQEFETNREKYDERFAKLPTVFQTRIARFRSNSPNFRWKYERYELFCCEQAVLFAETLKTPEAINAFYAMPWQEQLLAVPGMSDGHSGNTFGMACYLAKLYLTDPDEVVMERGAMTALTGAEEYGDLPIKS